MSIYRCNQCNHIAELAAESIGSTLKCPKCEYPNAVYDTTFFVGRVLEKFFALQTSLKRMQAEATGKEAAPVAQPPNLAKIDHYVIERTKATQELTQPQNLLEIDLYNTDQFASDLQHGPIHDWFADKKIQAKPNYGAVNTTGFYDEISMEIGRNPDFIGKIVDRIRYAQAKGHTSVHIDLNKHSQKDAQLITTFCRQLYDYSFVAKYFYQKTEKNIRLSLQTAPNIRNFFAGEWLEWFALMMLLEVSKEQQISFSCARNLSIVFSNEDIHELDVFFLLNGRTPICIECKNGEFRPFIDKYLTLRKRLGLDKQQFIVCVAGLPEEQATGLSNMYELTFLNEQGLKPYLTTIARDSLKSLGR